MLSMFSCFTATIREAVSAVSGVSLNKDDLVDEDV